MADEEAKTEEAEAPEAPEAGAIWTGFRGYLVQFSNAQWDPKWDQSGSKNHQKYRFWSKVNFYSDRLHMSPNCAKNRVCYR